MNPINTVFLAEKGITSTSANHLANIAQEYIVGHEAQLANVNFVSTSIDIVGSEAHNGKTIAQGYTNEQLERIPQLIAEIAEMNAFCAWTREAIRAKEYEQEAVMNTTFEEWCQRNGHEIPVYPFEEDVTQETVLAEYNIKERNRYLRTEAYAATIGKFIHQGRELSKAREALKQAISKPYATKGEGANTLIYHHSPSVEEVRVETLFFELQQQHREHERELNQMKWALKQREQELRLQNNKELRERQTAVTERIKSLEADFSLWQRQEHSRISKLKIAIPEELEPTLELLSALADKKQ